MIEQRARAARFLLRGLPVAMRVYRDHQAQPEDADLLASALHLAADQDAGHNVPDDTGHSCP